MTARWFFTRVGDVAEHEREAISARTNFMGEQLLPTSTPLPATLIHFWSQHSSAGFGCYGDPKNWTVHRLEARRGLTIVAQITRWTDEQ